MVFSTISVSFAVFSSHGLQILLFPINHHKLTRIGQSQIAIELTQYKLAMKLYSVAATADCSSAVFLIYTNVDSLSIILLMDVYILYAYR